LLGFTVVLFLFPQLESAMNDVTQRIELKFQKAGLSL